MNNTFEFNRFKKVIKHDGLSYFQNVGLTLIIFLSLPIVIWLFGIVFSSEGSNDVSITERIMTINVFLTILCIIAPVRLYKNCNDSRMGIGYAMLPASTLEKFLSMVFYCTIVTPFIYLVGALTIDSILAVISSSYDGYAISAYFNDMDQLENNIQLTLGKNYNPYDKETVFIMGLFSTTKLVFMRIFGILTISSIFMFGNMVFKKHKTGKMIGILIAIAIIFMLIQVKYTIGHIDDIQHRIHNGAQFRNYMRQLASTTFNVILILEIIVSAVMLWGTYHKIKTQKY